ncbi:hypothetical protein vseg_019660 [Gypsophila vaccaria]
MEVPLIAGDSIKWREASVPTTAHTAAFSSPATAPPSDDYASSAVFGSPPTYLIWRICKRLPHAIEILELHADKKLPAAGLRILFPEALSPFACICKNEINSGYGSVYLLYVLSISGVAYLLRLKDISTYASSFIFSHNEFLHFNANGFPDCSSITCATATAGYLVVGREDGTVNCFQLGVVDENAQGFMYELRDDPALSRLWGLMSRIRLVGCVKDLVISDIHGRKVLFVLHSDGSLRVWDPQRRGKIFSQSLGDQGTSPSRLWVGPVDLDTCSIPLVILYKHSSEVNTQGVSIYRITFPPGQKHSLSLVSLMRYLPLSEGKLIDVKFSSDKIWFLKEDGLLEWKLIFPSLDLEERRSYSMQEAFIAEQLFQSSEHYIDDLYQTTCSILSSSKAQIIGFLSSIFLRRLLRPGVFNGSVLCLTLQDYDKHWSDNEFKALTVDELKKEILLLIEHQAVSRSPFSAFECWKEFLSRYFDRWCKSNLPFSLLADPANGAVGLIRQNTVSLFRSFEDIELLMYGTFEEFGDFPALRLDSSSEDLEREILYEVLCCTRNLSRRLGPAISPILYESVVGASTMSPEDIVPRLLKTLESGYNASVAALSVSELGTDFVWQKELSDHKNLRKFSVDTLISIHGLCKKSNGWGKVLSVVENYLNLLVLRKPTENLDSEVVFSANLSIMVQATSQVAETMIKSAFDVLLFLSYIIDISGQVYMLPDDKSKIQLELIPMIQEIIAEWLIIHFLATMPSESPSVEDFSSQLSSLTIDNNSSKRSWTEKLGSVDFTLAFIVLLDDQGSSKGWNSHSLSNFTNPQSCINLIRHLSSWIIWGRSGKIRLHVFGHSIELALSLLRHGQYDAVENLLMLMDAHLRNEKLSGSVQSSDGEWCVLQHLLGCCFLAQAQRGAHGPSKEKKVREAMRCFFRASSGEGAAVALQKLLAEAGLSHLNKSGRVSSAAWTLCYYQSVMQKFEQFNIYDAACQFALAALEHVDEAISSDVDASNVFFTDESANSIKGRLWANVFKFSLDLEQYYDAYCAIVSNPDDESKYICLRRFIIVLYERGAMEILCNSHLPFIGLTEKAEQELAWKAACADLSARPHPYKLLYAFEMHQQNWRKAATYIYLYSVQLKNEMTMKTYQNTSRALQERMNGISAAINCLHLVHPMHAWISSQLTGSDVTHPSKRAKTSEEQCRGDSEVRREETYIGIEKLEDEFVLTSAEYMLCLANAKWVHTGSRGIEEDLLDHLVEANLYDMAFTVVLRFWKGSLLKRKLERVFSALALKCCPSRANSPMLGSPSLLLTYSKDEIMAEAPFDVESNSRQQRFNQWEVLEQNLEKYKGFHGRLSAVIAETLLRADPHIELPLWLVDMLKGRRREHIGMSGQESGPATLFGLYVDYGRFPEATELLVDFIEAYSSMRPAGIIKRKKPFAAWFPYTAIERLWCHLEESVRLGHMTEQCEKLKALLHGALRSHLILLKTDSEDAISSAIL